MMKKESEIIRLVSETLVKAGTTFTDDKIDAYRKAIDKEKNKQAKWVLETILKNAVTAEDKKSPLCDDTGIPHLVLDIGPKTMITSEDLADIYEGVVKGLNMLPGRPMSLMGNDMQRIDQSVGISEQPSEVEPAPILFRKIEDEIVRLHILMFGGGPEIRAKTYRIFHKHSVEEVENEIIRWAVEATSKLGCTPSTLAVGIGRSHFEASSMMVQAMIDGNYNCQSDIERKITESVNQSHIGPLGLGGESTVLATFLKVGPQRASGVRIVCLRPCCCFEPRIAAVELK